MPLCPRCLCRAALTGPPGKRWCRVCGWREETGTADERGMLTDDRRSEMTDEEYRRQRHEAITHDWRTMPDAARADIPAHLREGLDRYILSRIMPGDFLRCVLENDLHGAAVRANPPETMLQVGRLVQVLYTYAPACAFGDPQRVREWVKGEDG